MKINGPPGQLQSFLVLTFLLSWAIWIPLVLVRWGVGSIQLPDGANTLLSFLGVLMPAIFAIILTSRVGQAHSLLSRLFLWRVGWMPWVAAVLVQPALLALTALVYYLIFGEPPVKMIQQASAGGMVATIIFLLLATLGEEIGWRGLALPALQTQYTALKASVLLAFMYMAWHTLYWLAIGTVEHFGLFYMALNYLFAFPLTLYMSWFYNRGRFSILLAAAFHLSFNMVNTTILPVTANITAYAIFIAFEWIIALLLIPTLKSEKKPAEG